MLQEGGPRVRSTHLLPRLRGTNPTPAVAPGPRWENCRTRGGCTTQSGMLRSGRGIGLTGPTTPGLPGTIRSVRTMENTVRSGVGLLTATHAGSGSGAVDGSPRTRGTRPSGFVRYAPFGPSRVPTLVLILQPRLGNDVLLGFGLAPPRQGQPLSRASALVGEDSLCPPASSPSGPASLGRSRLPLGDPCPKPVDRFHAGAPRSGWSYETRLDKQIGTRTN